jgi:hypothetical protein
MPRITVGRRPHQTVALGTADSLPVRRLGALAAAPLLAALLPACWADIQPAPAENGGPTQVAEPDPGTVTIHRLNRSEYNNTVRDLLNTALRPADEFPADDTGYGFDNIADVLALSPLHLELYERAAAQLIDRVFPTRAVRTLIEAESATASTGAAWRDVGWNLFADGAIAAVIEVEEAGRYELSVRANGQDAAGVAAHMVFLVDGVVVDEIDVPEGPAFSVYTSEVTLTAGAREIGVGFTNDYWDPDAGEDRNLIVDWFALDGPLDSAETPERAAVLTCALDGSDDRACAEAVLARFAGRAWRRPIEDAEFAELLALFDAALAADASAEEALSYPLQAVLLSPHFLFRVELDEGEDPEEPHLLGPYELASRLSYFLWSSMPDEPLLAAAADGSLHDPEVLAAQARRMLADPRSRALVDGFAAQWLYIRDIDNAFPDTWRFPEFDEELRGSMREEMTRFFESFVRSPRDMRDLLLSETTFVDARLAAHYGLPAPGDGFHEVSAAELERGGLLTQAGLMMVLSTPLRTSIVRRGKWVLTQLLCAEPPPPPPGVEGLVEDENEGLAEGLTLRERLEVHRADPSCAACHAEMDDIGFGLEGFDGIGSFRTEDNGVPIDASGRLADGSTFVGARALAELIAADARFGRCVTQKLYTYALGRGPEENDRPYLQDLSERFMSDGYLFESLVVDIVTSDPFRMRRAEHGSTR